MKVLMVNGSPHKKGCTYTALNEIAEELKRQDVESEIVWIGTGPIHGCNACRVCKKNPGACIYDDDICNELIQKISEADGVILGAPVYYAGINGGMSALMDRVFFASGTNFRGKPGAGVVSCRRGGASASFDRFNKYFTIMEMPVVTSQYWNSVHGNTPEEVKQDLEGLQVMRILAKNMAWMLKAIENQPKPEFEQKSLTNFIR